MIKMRVNTFYACITETRTDGAIVADAFGLKTIKSCRSSQLLEHNLHAIRMTTRQISVNHVPSVAVVPAQPGFSLLNQKQHPETLKSTATRIEIYRYDSSFNPTGN